MSYFDELVSQLNGFVGKTVTGVNVVETQDGGEAVSLGLVFDDGKILEIAPSSYNYGPQDLVIDIVEVV